MSSGVVHFKMYLLQSQRVGYMYFTTISVYIKKSAFQSEKRKTKQNKTKETNKKPNQKKKKKIWWPLNFIHDWFFTAEFMQKG